MKNLIVLAFAAGLVACSSTKETPTTPSYPTVPEYRRVGTDTDTRVHAPPTYVETAPVVSSKADDTSINARDRDGWTKTPFDQGASDADVNTTREIRRRVMDAGLSIDAQNVKIITLNGRVSLRGPVQSMTERELIDRIARQVAGTGAVDDQLEIKQPR
jgi:hyperosmotically inducible protein